MKYVWNKEDVLVLSDEKYNPYHDAHGRFGSGGAGTHASVRTLEEAISQLGSGQAIYLQKPEHAVTMLHKLAEIAQDAKSKGEKAPTYDLCKVAVKGTNLFCLENVHISRDKMPQLSGHPLPGTPADKLPRTPKGEVDLGPAFVDFLRAQGHTVTLKQVDASFLRASQNQLNGAKVAGMLQSLDKGTLPPGSIFTSSDNYVIDGHHRWAAQVGYALEHHTSVSMDVKEVSLPILQSLQLANQFAASMGIPQAGVSKLDPISYVVAVDVINAYTPRKGYHQ